MVIVPAPPALSTKAQPGDPLIFDWPPELKRLSLDGLDFTRFTPQTALAVVPRRDRPYSTIVGEHALTGATLRLFQYFLDHEQRLFLHTLVVGDPTKKTVTLRLPTTVLKKLNARDEDTRRRELAEFKAIQTSQAGRLTSECWQRPLRSRVVSEFASPRSVPGGREYFHSGVDLRAGSGTPVPASASGVVIYTGHMTVPGHFVSLAHGDGLISHYMHLDKIDVTVGQHVRRGEIIAHSGATGRVEAPHLHWEVVWKGIPANPLRFLAALEPICDRE